MAFFATIDGTNEIIFGFIIPSWVVCVRAMGGVSCPFLVRISPAAPATFRGTTLPSDRKSSTEPKSGTTDPNKKDGGDKDMGHALRSVYEKTVNEAIPDEMLDLLGKLG
jgi:hypothetical protein